MTILVGFQIASLPALVLIFEVIRYSEFLLLLSSLALLSSRGRFLLFFSHFIRPLNALISMMNLIRSLGWNCYLTSHPPRCR